MTFSPIAGPCFDKMEVVVKANMWHLGMYINTIVTRRYVTQGMVKSSTNDVYWEVMGLRRRMACARLGFES